MSTFACGGGSSMGYKRAGCEVIAANDIDPEMAWHYQKNIHTKHYFLGPIRSLLSQDLPSELFSLDILDGSPPCSTFSMSGKREAGWGKEKHFREGQAKQILSDLFFDFIDLAEKLKPKVIIAENVKGMIIGNAKGYTKMILARLRDIGYLPQLFLIDAADCGVPQKRERVFFCAVRSDVSQVKLVLNPSQRRISTSEACFDLNILTDEEKNETRPFPCSLKWWPLTEPGQSFSKAMERVVGKGSLFSHIRLSGAKPANTLTSQMQTFSHWSENRQLTMREAKRLGSFPDDYQVKNNKLGKYLIGMSVPPKMAEYVARAVCSQWLNVDYSKEPKL